MYIADFCAKFQIFRNSVPRQNAAKRLFTLLVDIIRIFAIVNIEHRNAAFRIEIPCLQSESVSLSGVVVHLLQDVEIAERTILIPLDRVIFADDSVIGIVNILRFHVIPVLEIVVREGVYHACRTLPMFVSVSQTQVFIECFPHTDALYVLYVEPFGICWFGGENDRTAQTAARGINRRSAVQQRCIVDEVRRDHREIDHAQHRRVDLHAVPRHLRMRGRRTAERYCREGCATVLLNIYRRAEFQGV